MSPEPQESHNGIPTLYAPDREVFRQWLEDNHESAPALMLILYHKASGKACVRYDEAVEEALCFGWIDSKMVKRDAESAYQTFSPRKPKGNWSPSNKERAARMISEGKMRPAGQYFIDLAKENGSWDRMSESIPEDLQAAFDQNPTAFEYFQAFAPSSRQLILNWIRSAKRPETRQQRVEKTVSLAAENKKAHP